MKPSILDNMDRHEMTMEKNGPTFDLVNDFEDDDFNERDDDYKDNSFHSPVFNKNGHGRASTKKKSAARNSAKRAMPQSAKNSRKTALKIQSNGLKEDSFKGRNRSGSLRDAELTNGSG